jgi:hypothetical protein
MTAAADLSGHDPLQYLLEFRVPDGCETFPHHIPVASRKPGKGGSGWRLLCGAGRRRGDITDCEKKTPDLFLSVDFVDLAEDLLLHELELMQPDRRGNPDEEGASFHRVGMGLGGDLRTHGPSPGVEKISVRRGMGDIPRLEDLLEDLS